MAREAERGGEEERVPFDLPPEIQERRAYLANLKRQGTPPGLIDVADDVLLDEDGQ